MDLQSTNIEIAVPKAETKAPIFNHESVIASDEFLLGADTQSGKFLSICQFP